MVTSNRQAPEQISVDAARRMAVAAQGFADPRPSGPVGVGHVRSVIDRVGVLQIDSANVLCRSHYLPIFARLGLYSRTILDRMAWGDDGRELFEYFWGHKAALIPLRAYPLLRWRMQAAAGQTWDGSIERNSDVQVPSAMDEGMQRLTKNRPGLIDEVLEAITENGPIAAGNINLEGARQRGPKGEGGRMWNWNDTKIAVEWLFSAGKVTIATRRNFERLYDLTERTIPADVLTSPPPTAEAAQRELVRIAARAQGVATARELCAPGRSYSPLPSGYAKSRIAELVEEGDLIPIRIEGMRKHMYVWRGAQDPRQVYARALLSPFDSLIWTRDRTQWLFNFHYRTSIYTPAHQRLHGYYVLPFLLGDQLVARVDVKADRSGSTLAVPVVNIEPGHRSSQVAAELADELRLMANWLELDRVQVGSKGNLASALSRAVEASR